MSLNDLAVVVALLKHDPQPSEATLLDFLKVDKQGEMFEVGAKQRNVKYKHTSYCLNTSTCSMTASTPRSRKSLISI